MQLAEKNIEERQQGLRFDFNRQRQKVIDEELIELISEFEVLSSPPPGSFRCLER